MKQKKYIVIIVSILLIGILLVYTIFQSNQQEESFMQEEEEIYTREKEEEKEEEIEIVVHIVGEVKKQGIVHLKEGSRIIDAVTLAEGFTEKADITQINLAQILQDGEMIVVPCKEEKKEETTQTEQIAGTKSTKVNINTATVQELQTLDGIGEGLATRIINFRKQNGKFKKVEDLQNVSGIGKSKYEKIKEKICV